MTIYESPCDGARTYLVECHGMVQSISSCIRRANELCPAGYDVLGRREDVQGVIVSAYGAVTPIYRELAVRCR